MKDKLIQALTIEYEAVYLIDLNKDSFETLKQSFSSPAMSSSSCWSAAVGAFAEECSEESSPIIKMFADPAFLKSALSKNDCQECTFSHTASDSRWRKAVIQVISSKGKYPSIVLMTVSLLDKISAQREELVQKLLAETGNNFDKRSPLYNLLLLDETSNSEHKMFDGLNILFVDENDILRAISREILQNEGATVTEAENGLEAVNLVKEYNNFDFIIMDIVMPVMDGIRATKKISEYQKDQEEKTPIIGLTADGTEEQKEKIIDAGAIACLTKPFNPREMAKILIAYMKEKSLVMQEKMAEITMLSNTDMLTQTGNVVSYTHDLGQLAKEINGGKQDSGIVICDLDNLKGINDKYGHDVGDVYIKNCCSLIKDVFKDIPLYRIGGDEFALIVDGDDLTKLDTLTDKLNKRSKTLESQKDVTSGKASVSSGYAIYDPAIDQSINDTMKRADYAMYETKVLHKKWFDIYNKP